MARKLKKVALVKTQNREREKRRARTQQQDAASRAEANTTDTVTRGYDKEKLSLFISSEVARKVRRSAREMGVSFNSWFSMASAYYLNFLRTTLAGNGATATFLPSPATPSTALPASTSPHAPITGPIVMHPPQRAKAMEERLKKFGKGHYTAPDPDGGGRLFAPWDDCVRYAREAERVLDEYKEETGKSSMANFPDYERMAKRCGIPERLACACADAYDNEGSDLKSYMTTRYGDKVFEDVIGYTQDVGDFPGARR